MKFINDILVLGKRIFYQDIYQVWVIFSSMHASGLKYNAPKWSFGLKYIPYLGL